MPAIGSYPYATFVSGGAPKIDKSRGIQFDSLNPNESLKARSRGRRRSKEVQTRNTENQEIARKYQSNLRSVSPNARKGNGTSPQIIQHSHWQKWEHTGSISCVSPQRNPQLRPHPVASSLSIGSSKSTSPRRPRTVPAPGPQPFGNISFNPNLQPCQINPNLGPQLFVELEKRMDSPNVSPRQHDHPLGYDESRPTTPSLSLGAPPAPVPPQPRIDLVIPTASIPDADRQLKKQTELQSGAGVGGSSLGSPDRKQDLIQRSVVISLPVLSPLGTKTNPSRSPLYRMEEGRRRHSSEAQHRMIQNDARAERWKNMRMKNSPKSNRHGMTISPSSIASSYAVGGNKQSWGGFNQGSFEMRKTEASSITSVPGDQGGNPVEQLMRQARKPIKHYTCHLDPRPSLRSTMKPGTSTYLTLARK